MDIRFFTIGFKGKIYHLHSFLNQDFKDYKISRTIDGVFGFSVMVIRKWLLRGVLNHGF
jgi:hypothetical protein